MHLQTVSWQSSSVRASIEIGNDCNVIAVLCAASSIAVIDCLLDRSCSMLEIQFLRSFTNNQWSCNVCGLGPAAAPLCFGVPLLEVAP